MHILLLEKKGITESDITGDGIGYSLTVKKNYKSYEQKLKDMGKVSNIGQQTKKHKRKLFAYMFAIMDLKTRMYVAFGSSMKSEKEAFDRAMNFLKTVD